MDGGYRDHTGTEAEFNCDSRFKLTWLSLNIPDKENLVLEANVISKVKGNNGDKFCLHSDIMRGREKLVSLLEAMGNLGERIDVDPGVEFSDHEDRILA